MNTMMNKLYRIWILCVTNPLAWLIGGMAVLTQIGFAYAALSSSGGAFLIPSTVLTDYGNRYICRLKSEPGDVPGMLTIGNEPIPEDTVSLNLSNMIRDPKVWEEIKNLPNLRSLETDWMLDQDFRPLTELTNLESLSLKPHPQPFYADKNPGGETVEKGPSLPSLKNLTKLRELEVTSLPLADVVEAVRENTNLTTLVYHGDLLKDCTSEEIGRLAELKQLRVLSIGPFLRWSEGNTLRDEFVPFQNQPELKILWLMGQSLASEDLEQIRGVLPEIVVLSFRNLGEILQGGPILFLSGHMLFMVVMFWISLTQMHNDLFFRYLGAAMLPRYAAPHLLFSGLLLFFWVALNALLLWGSGIPMLAALSILLTPVGFFSLASCRAINPTPSPKSQRKQVAIGAVIFIVVFTFASGGVTGSWLTASTPRFLMETIWIEWIRFVYGFHPLVCLVSLAVAGYLMFT
ncbi:MAG: leucine-rich repeat domain-containing protein, partial [Planctomycetaceae bacterium]|nr:leucine-rich repeat domain-containing protein [Planctomycetaceae bacterium]